MALPGEIKSVRSCPGRQHLQHDSKMTGWGTDRKLEVDHVYNERLSNTPRNPGSGVEKKGPPSRMQTPCSAWGTARHERTCTFQSESWRWTTHLFVFKKANIPPCFVQYQLLRAQEYRLDFAESKRHLHCFHWVWDHLSKQVVTWTNCGKVQKMKTDFLNFTVYFEECSLSVVLPQ